MQNIFKRRTEGMPFLWDENIKCTFKIWEGTIGPVNTKPAGNLIGINKWHTFVRDKGKKTIGLENYILPQSLELSSVNSSKLLKLSGITISKSSICDML